MNGKGRYAEQPVYEKLAEGESAEGARTAEDRIRTTRRCLPLSTFHFPRSALFEQPFVQPAQFGRHVLVSEEFGKAASSLGAEPRAQVRMTSQFN